MSKINENYLSTQTTSLIGLKNNLNQIVTGLAKTSLQNLLINSKLKFFLNGNTLPFGWSVAADTGSVDIDIDGYYSVVNFISGTTNQYISQDITDKLEPSTTYLLVVSIEASQNCGFELTNSSGFINLSNDSILSTSFTPTDLITSYDNYFLFKTSEVFSNISFKIKNNYSGDNEITIKKLSLSKGSLELFDILDKHFFLENVKYSHDSFYDPIGIYSWKITGDGSSWVPIALADTPTSLLTKIKSVDGVGSGLDANFFNGKPISDFQMVSDALDLTDFQKDVVGNFGYQKLPSGVILQWCVSAEVTPGGESAAQTITFPIAFPNACLTAIVGTSIASYTVGGDVVFQIIGTPTTSSVVVTRQSIAGNDTVNSWATIFAIGY